jgi:hypothetical protein
LEDVSFLWTQWKRPQHIEYLGGGAQHVAQDQSGLLNSYRSQDPLTAIIHKREGQRENTLGNGFKLYNRMEQNKQLTNKKGVFLNMREYYYLIGQDPFDVLPLTFLIKRGKGQAE